MKGREEKEGRKEGRREVRKEEREEEKEKAKARIFYSNEEKSGFIIKGSDRLRFTKTKHLNWEEGMISLF